MRIHRLIISLLTIVLGTQVVLAGDVIKVCGQNVQNFFYSLDRGRTMSNYASTSNYNTEEGRTKKLNAIVNALSTCQADIYAFNEVECCAESVELLAQAMSTSTGKTYQAVADGLTYDLSVEPDGVIKSAFIYNTATIEPVGENVSTAYGYTWIYPNQMRMQTFKSKTSGESFTLSMNHFKASTSSDVTEDIKKREANAAALLNGLTSALDPDILVIGDLNAEIEESSVQQLVDAGYEEQLLKYYTGPMYTHCYGGGSLIDHVLANGTMAQQVTNAEILHVANECSTGSKYTSYSDHDPYLVTLELKHMDTPTYSFVKATAVKAGGQYLFAANLNGSLEIAKPVATNKSYDYLYTQSVTENNGTITMTNMDNAFTFENASEGQFYIKDSNGRYAYQTSKSNGYYTTMAMTNDKSLAHKYTATKQDDGTFKVLSQTGYYIYGTVYNNTTPEFAFANYATLYSGNVLPWLYEYTTTPSTIQEVNYTVAPTDGRYYNLAGQQVEHPTKGLYIVNGKKIIVR